MTTMPTDRPDPAVSEAVEEDRLINILLLILGGMVLVLFLIVVPFLIGGL